MAEPQRIGGAEVFYHVIAILRGVKRRRRHPVAVAALGIALMLSVTIPLACRPSGPGYSGTSSKSGRISTTKGQVIAALSVGRGPNGSTYRIPMLIAVNEATSGELLPGFTVHIAGREGCYLTYHGERIRAPEGAVIFCDLEAKEYRVIGGLEWKRDVFDNDKKFDEFVREVVEERLDLPDKPSRERE